MHWYDVCLPLFLMGLSGQAAFRRDPWTRFRTAACIALIVSLAPDGERESTKRKETRADLAGIAEAGEQEGSRISDIILITVDSLRADRLGAYGYARRTTPNLDALARQALRFERAYTPTPHTSLAIGSLLTGRSLWSAIRLTPERTYPTLPELLAGAGYRSAAFYPPAVFFTESARLKHYEESRFGFEYAEVDYFDAMAGVKRTLAFLERTRQERTFVWLHLFEPHEPYEDHPEHTFGPRDCDRYDSEVSYTDFALGRLFEYLARTRPGAAIVVTSDHGEAFDEHGDRYHGTSLYDEQSRIPLILKLPGRTAQAVLTPASLLDLSPTLLSLAGVMLPRGLQGQALIPVLPGSRELDAPIFAELGNFRMVVSRDRKLLCNIARGGCALYALALDPKESLDRSADEKATAAALRSKLEHRLTEATKDYARQADSWDPGWVLVGRARLGDRSSATALARLLKPAVPLRLRRESARWLAELPLPAGGAGALGHALRDSDPETAGWAAVAGLKRRLPAARAAGRRMLDQSASSEELRTALALALGAQGERVALPTLVRALPRCTEPLRCLEIVRTLGRLRDSRALPELLAALPRVEIRREVVEALGNLATPATVPALIDSLLHDTYVPVRVAAARALGRIQTPMARQALEYAAERDTESVVAMAARQSTARLAASSLPRRPARLLTQRDK